MPTGLDRFWFAMDSVPKGVQHKESTTTPPPMAGRVLQDWLWFNSFPKSSVDLKENPDAGKTKKVNKDYS